LLFTKNSPAPRCLKYTLNVESKYFTAVHVLILMRERLNISEDILRSCLQEKYGLTPLALEFLPLGLDSKTAIYRVMSNHGVRYLLKVKMGSLYEPSCSVPRYLNDQGISSVVAPVLTKNHALWAKLDGWAVIVYPFLEGDTSWTGMTDEHWKEVGTIFKRIHQTAAPLHGFQPLRKETFDPGEYLRLVRAFEIHHVGKLRDGNASERSLRSSWMAHQSTINTAVTSLEKLARVLQSRSGAYVLCHADLHPANLIRDRTGQVFVIDWDDVMLAPKERDFIFAVNEPSRDSSIRQDLPPFFQGYGETEIDWVGLTYYHWERVVQDLIECAQEVFLRDDLSEEAKADAVQLFDTIVAGEGQVQAAYAAAAKIHFDPRSS
jgi:spectinomycin phosphotransferase